MTSLARIVRINFNISELAEILIEEDFNYVRAGRWMDEHVLFSLQATAMYIMAIFAIKHWMRGRQPLKLQPFVVAWNFSIALLSGFCAAGMTSEYFDSTVNKGFNASLCSTREEFFGGKNGFALFVFLFARLAAFSDTIFIVLRKQPLLFFHWYHHAVTLCISWFSYPGASPSSRHAIYFNAVIHTVLYSYFFLVSINIRPPKVIGRWIIMAEIVHFFFILYALARLTYLAYIAQASGTKRAVPCQIEPYSLVFTWIMDLSYLYLFIDFFMKGSTTTKKIDKED